MADANPELVPEADALKRRRTQIRRKITSRCNQIELLFREGKSRRIIKSFLQECQALKEAELVNDRILEQLDEHDEEGMKLSDLQTTYSYRVAEISEAVRDYCESFPDDLSQTATEVRSNVSETRAPPVEGEEGSIAGESEARPFIPEPERPDQSPKLPDVIDAVSQISEQLSNSLGKATEDAFNKPKSTRSTQAKAVERNPGTPKNRVSEWLESQETEHEAPDAWIDAFVHGKGQLTATSSSCSKHSEAKLEPYSGSALEWFQWIDLFRSLVHETRKSPGEKLAILRRSLRDECADIVYGLGGGEKAYKAALSRLRENCGRRDVMRAAHIQAIEKLEVGKNSTAFKRIAERVRTHLFDLDRIGGCSHRDLIERITAKLSVQDRLTWNEGCSSGIFFHDIERFGSWLCRRAAAYQNAYDIAAEQEKTNKEPEKRFKGRSHNASAEPMKRSKPTGCWNCGGDHRLDSCPKFQALPISDRQKFAEGKRLCFSCLRGKHLTRDCRTGRACGIGGCQSRHHRLLHRIETITTGNTLSVHTNQHRREAVALGVLTVRVVDAKGRRVKANMLIDEGSNMCLIQDDFLRHLGFAAESYGLELHGVGGQRGDYRTQQVEVEIEGENGLLPVVCNSIPKVCEDTERIEWIRLKKRWTHLKDLPLFDSGGEIHPLIGSNYNHLLNPIEVRRGKKGEPGAIRTDFGWVARGVIGPNGSRGPQVNLIRAVYNNLDDTFRAFCETESFGTEYASGPVFSKEDSRAIKTFAEGTKFLNPGFEVALPWREGEPDLKNNRAMAELRFMALTRKFAKDPEYETDYKEAIRKYLVQGYAHKIIATEELEHPHQYFLQHHGVYKRSAANKKLRVVFDSAAKFEGKSLNDALLPGPALQADIPTVICKFREQDVAFIADIEAMFSRIRMREDDARYHRFLWKEEGSDVTGVFQMYRLAFGDSCSPFIAIHTIRKVAEDLRAHFPEAALALQQNLYMDDYLDSTATEDQATARIRGVVDLLSQGDFNLGKWVTNRPRILEPLGMEEHPDRTTDNEDYVTKVLGVRWAPSRDVLTSGITAPQDLKFTRRGLLKALAEVFDPMVFLAPVTVKAKIKLRELGLSGLGWDDDIPEGVRQWWQEWLGILNDFRHIEIPRCLFPDEDSIDTVELHTFGDASQEAVAAVIYVRVVYQDGRTHTNIVMAKTKLTPLKTISVAKAELNAALLGARLADYVGKALRRTVNRRVFWTDSSCARNWIRGTSSYYKPFVSNRIGEIQTLTRPEEWRYVPGKRNSSDVATRSSLDIQLEDMQPWSKGPDFLLQREDAWPQDIPWIVKPDEMRPTCGHRCLVASRVSVKVDWDSVKPEDCAAFRNMTEPLKDLLRACQLQEFDIDIRRLREGVNMTSNSKILGFNPFLDSDGLLRVGGRLDAADLPYENKHPVLLPAKHPLTERIIQEYHRRLLHAGVNHVLAHLRETYWVLNGREAVKRVRRSCTECKIEVARPATQLMGGLPPTRLEVSPPFTHTSVDYFGPLEIVQGNNRTTKRYGALFTCMVTRAVHLDLARSLSMEDFLMVLRRFISIRGKPLTIYSDNGTNFVGAEREINQLIETTRDDESLKGFCGKQGIKWTFQPPLAPHFGGVHESLVKSAKRALYKVLAMERDKKSRITEEILRTLLFEVMGFLNGRPLMYVSSDPKDMRVITPNDFLNQRSSSNFIPVGEITTGNPRKLYKYLEKVVAVLWDVWKKQYVPTLTRRAKWRTRQRDFQTGDAVLVLEPNLVRGKWLHGRIVEVVRGTDGPVRSAMVETDNGVYHRPIHKLSLLDPAPAEESVGAAHRSSE